MTMVNNRDNEHSVDLGTEDARGGKELGSVRWVLRVSLAFAFLLCALARLALGPVRLIVFRSLLVLLRGGLALLIRLRQHILHRVFQTREQAFAVTRRAVLPRGRLRVWIARLRIRRFRSFLILRRLLLIAVVDRIARLAFFG